MDWFYYRAFHKELLMSGPPTISVTGSGTWNYISFDQKQARCPPTCNIQVNHMAHDWRSANLAFIQTTVRLLGWKIVWLRFLSFSPQFLTWTGSICRR